MARRPVVRVLGLETVRRVGPTRPRRRIEPLHRTRLHSRLRRGLRLHSRLRRGVGVGFGPGLPFVVEHVLGKRLVVEHRARLGLVVEHRARLVVEHRLGPVHRALLVVEHRLGHGIGLGAVPLRPPRSLIHSARRSHRPSPRERRDTHMLHIREHHRANGERRHPHSLGERRDAHLVLLQIRRHPHLHLPSERRDTHPHPLGLLMGRHRRQRTRRHCQRQPGGEHRHTDNRNNQTMFHGPSNYPFFFFTCQVRTAKNRLAPTTDRIAPNPRTRLLPGKTPQTRGPRPETSSTRPIAQTPMNAPPTRASESPANSPDHLPAGRWATPGPCRFRGIRRGGLRRCRGRGHRGRRSRDLERRCRGRNRGAGRAAMTPGIGG